MARVTDTLYENVIVNKPWGHEYLMFRNQDVALWCLRLAAGESTSLHCHPRKKTGLIVVSGSITLRFLNNSSQLVSPANVMIRPGLFHQSVADAGSDAVLIEVESPVDKLNLVRLDDDYGRARTTYEPVSATRPLDSSCLRLPQPAPGRSDDWGFHGRRLCLRASTDAEALADALLPRDIVVVLEGGLFTEDGEPILTAGDSVSSATLCRLSRAFRSPSGLSALIVSSPDA